MPSFLLSFRPPSYEIEPARTIASIAGTLRRQQIRDELLDGTPSGLPPVLRLPTLPSGARAIAEALNPAMAGGEHLPPLRGDEIEIARVQYTQTVACEVTSVRARRDAGIHRYSIVDELDGGRSGYLVDPEESRDPLTMRGLVRMIDRARLPDDPMRGNGLVLGDLAWRHSAMAHAPQDLAGFVIASSEFYPELESWYRHAVVKWVKRMLAGLEAPLDSEALLAL